MPTQSGLVTKQELIDAQLDTAHLGRVVNSKDASGNPIDTSTNRTGGVNKTLDALEAEFQHAVDAADEFTDTPNDTFTTSDGQTKRSVTGINSDADAQRDDIQARSDQQYQDIENTFNFVAFEYSTDPELLLFPQLAVYDDGAGNLSYFKPLSYPYQTDSTTYPNPIDDPNLLNVPSGDTALITASGTSDTRTNADWMKYISVNQVYNTTIDMISSGDLKDGDTVLTHGYYGVGDGGGGMFLISSSNYNYSIDVGGGLFANFDDDFSIKKFGVVSDFSLDQDENLARMCAYIDESEIVDIDFLGFEIRAPQNLAFTSTRGTNWRGLVFNKIVRIKNLKIQINKSITSTNGNSLILIVLDDSQMHSGLIGLENIVLDPYTSDYNIDMSNLEYDGGMLGIQILAMSNNRVQSEIDINVSNVKSISPALSYNISSDIRYKNVRVTDCCGDYLGLYVQLIGENESFDNVNGKFRDDLYGQDGRTLATTLIHMEPEQGGIEYAYNKIIMSNSSCYRSSDGTSHILFKIQRTGPMIAKKLIVNECVGETNVFFNTVTDELLEGIDEVVIKNSGEAYGVQLEVPIRTLTIDGNFKRSKTVAYILGEYKINKLRICNCYPIPRLGINGSPAINIGILNIDSSSVEDNTYGVIRQTTGFISNVNITNTEVSAERILECEVDSVNLFNIRSTNDTLANFIYCRGIPSEITIGSSNFKSTSGVHVLSDEESTLEVNYTNIGRTLSTSNVIVTKNYVVE